MGTFSGSGRREFLKWVLASGFSTVLLDKDKTWAQNPADTSIKATLILHNGRIATQDGRTSFAKALASVLTIVAGNPVYASEEFQDLAPPPLPVSPDWSPVKYFGGYQTPSTVSMATAHTPLHLGCCVPSAGNALNSSVINSSMLSPGASAHFLAASVAVWVAVWDALVSSETSPKPYLWQ